MSVHGCGSLKVLGLRVCSHEAIKSKCNVKLLIMANEKDRLGINYWLNHSQHTHRHTHTGTHTIIHFYYSKSI